ncbi:response regulator [Massilia sp. H-1]|nr:response regulator [Massilia sp. H-1]
MALFVTGLTAPEDIARYMEAGAIGVIPKPLVPAAPGRTIAHHVGRAPAQLRLSGADRHGRVSFAIMAVYIHPGQDHHENQGSDRMESGTTAHD